MTSLESEIQNITGDVYIMSEVGIIFVCILIGMCFLMSLVFFVKMVVLSWEIDRIKVVNDTSFENIRDWITILAECKKNNDDKKFLEAIKKIDENISRRRTNCDYYIEDKQQLVNIYWDEGNDSDCSLSTEEEDYYSEEQQEESEEREESEKREESESESKMQKPNGELEKKKDEGNKLTSSKKDNNPESDLDKVE